MTDKRITVRVENADTGEVEGEVVVHRVPEFSFHVTEEDMDYASMTREPLAPPRIKSIEFTVSRPLATEDGIYKLWMPKVTEEDA